MSRIDEILDFWFLPPSDPAHGAPRAIWFQRDDAFDRAIRARFEADVTRAREGELDAWLTTARGALAYVVVLDQFSRNIYRDDPRAFAGDARALAATKLAIARGLDAALAPFERAFLYMPLMHSESLSDQTDSVTLFTKITAEDPRIDQVPWAISHRATIARFGRFPLRNAALGRASTPEEMAFIAEHSH
jgi:uncharacterized protein (DUF924 family)